MHQPLEVGALSADGSRVWTGSFWAVNPAHIPRAEDTPSFSRPAPQDLPYEHRGFGCLGVVVAGAVGVVLSYFHPTVQVAGSINQALTELAVANLLWVLFSYGCVVVIVSVGRQGLDVLLMRSIVVGFILGAGIFGVRLLAVFSDSNGLIALLVSGLVWAVTVGPHLFVMAMLANLLLYRSLRSLRPQLGVFNRASAR